MWEGETVVWRCDSSQGGVKVVRNRLQLMERYDGHGEDVRGCGKVCHLVENCDDHGGGEHWLGEV